MKYFIDTEFIEGFHKPLFGKRRHFIDLISIGVVCEDGREYYAISTEFNYRDASDWVRENVIRKLPRRTFNGYNIDEAKLWKSNKQIAEEIIQFSSRDYSFEGQTWYHNDDKCDGRWSKSNPDFYGYYCDYVWVVFCSLFGTMMDLPIGFPMYCRDLKQTLDEVVDEMHREKPQISKERCLEELKSLDFKNPELSFPKQANEHNALADARWNKELYSFLQSIKIPC